MSKIYKSFDEYLKEQTYMRQSYETVANEAWLARQPEIEQLKQQRDAFQEAAMQWMRWHEELKVECDNAKESCRKYREALESIAIRKGKSELRGLSFDVVIIDELLEEQQND